MKLLSFSSSSSSLKRRLKTTIEGMRPLSCSLVFNILIFLLPNTSNSFLLPFASRELVLKQPTTNFHDPSIALTSLRFTMALASCKESTKTTFRGKTVFLTGASGGLGAAFAEQLAGCGVATLILSARNMDKLQQVAKTCQERSYSKGLLTVHTLACDLSDPKSVDETAKMARTLASNKIDILINNGGMSSRSRFLDTTLQVDERLMQVNFMSGVAFCKAFCPGMAQRKNGFILWISSVQGLVGIPNRSSYAASKFAVQGYTESIRAELVADGISVHTVSPGYIRTNLSTSAVTGDGQTYGKMDATTEAGADPMNVAVEVLDRVAAGEQDFTVSIDFNAMAAIYLRTLFPGLLRSLLVKRYDKSQNENKKSD
jgi:dehydrogenase/reductase SDR family member 7B